MNKFVLWYVLFVVLTALNGAMAVSFMRSGELLPAFMHIAVAVLCGGCMWDAIRRANS